MITRNNDYGILKDNDSDMVRRVAWGWIYGLSWSSG